MIEIIRFALSLLVVEAHIWPLGAPWIAWMAVFAFYTLSGFLMTRVLHERYGFSGSGTALFTINRLLRLGPAYLVIAAMGMAVIVARAPLLYPMQRMPHTWLDYAANLFVIGQVGFDTSHVLGIKVLVPNAWSLSIELVCYLLLALYFARSSARLWTFAALGAMLLTFSTAACVHSPSPIYDLYCFQNRYTVIQAGFIPFAIGGLVYLHHKRLVALPREMKAIAALFVAVLFAFTVPIEVMHFTVAPFVGSAGIAVVLLLTPRDYGSPVTEFLGRSSYHQFLAHWTIASVLLLLLPLTPNSFALFATTVAVGLILSGALVPVERRIDAWRKAIRIRSRAPVIAAE